MKYYLSLQQVRVTTVAMIMQFVLISFPAFSKEKPIIYGPPIPQGKKQILEPVSGTECPVCQAYKQSFERQEYTEDVGFAMCQSRIVKGIPGLEALPTRELTVQEMEPFFPSVSSFNQYSKTQGNNGLDEKYKASTLETFHWLVKNEQVKMWKFEPRIDINNDGRVDNVLMWQEDFCMAGASAPSTPSGMRPFVFTDNWQEIDYAISSPFYWEHPEYEAGGAGTDDARMYFGPFKYREKIYFDRFDTLPINKITRDQVAIFRIDIDKTVEMCRFRLKLAPTQH